MNYTFSKKIASLKPSAIREMFKNVTDPNIISFAAGNPAPESFPVEALRILAADILEKEPVTALQYGITEGYTPLREAITARQRTKFGTVAEGEAPTAEDGFNTFNEADFAYTADPGAEPSATEAADEEPVARSFDEILAENSRDGE